MVSTPPAVQKTPEPVCQKRKPNKFDGGEQPPLKRRADNGNSSNANFGEGLRPTPTSEVLAEQPSNPLISSDQTALRNCDNIIAHTDPKSPTNADLPGVDEGVEPECRRVLVGSNTHLGASAGPLEPTARPSLSSLEKRLTQWICFPPMTASDSQGQIPSGTLVSVDNPFMRLARENGSIQLNGMQGANAPGGALQPQMMPNFSCARADVQPVLAREGLTQPTAPGLPHAGEKLDYTSISGVHEWPTKPIAEMSWSYFVTNPLAEHVRADVMRWKQLSEVNEKTARDAWSQFAASRSWWKIPNSVVCDRTFAREHYDVAYLDRMTTFLRTKPCIFDARDIPMTKNFLTRRWWSRFACVPNFLYNAFVRRRAGLMVPFDSFESSQLSDSKLRDVFPACPAWLDLDAFPPGVPCPVPPCVWYFHLTMLKATTASEQMFWARLFAVEWLSLYAACWWEQATAGGRAIWLPLTTIEKMRDLITGVQLGPGVWSDRVIKKMEEVHSAPWSTHNLFVIRNLQLPQSYYIDCQRETALLKLETSGHTTYFQDGWSRRVRQVVREQHRFQNRSASPLELLLTDHDLNRVQDLREHVIARGWGQNRFLTVQDLLSFLMEDIVALQFQRDDQY